jgi:quercetin 2,3-dioxygenase
MSIRIIPKARQGRGAFNGGQIIENKPVVMSPDSTVQPFSNLFYWAHAKAVVDSTIGLHPHQGFEICSFVLKGQIRHYDTSAKEWIPLQAGDVQIIRSGSGISHSEFMGEGSEMFQIWFDPNLQETISIPATYDDYRADQFPKQQPANEVEVTTLVGDDSPFRMRTPGVGVQRIQFGCGSHALPLGAESVAAIYILEGEVLINGERVGESDFVVAYMEDNLQIESLAGAQVFAMTLPMQPPYATYAASRSSR